MGLDLGYRSNWRTFDVAVIGPLDQALVMSGLLGVYSRCGLHTRANFVTAIRGLQTFRHLHACPGCFRLERSPGGACTRWISAALSRRTRKPAIACALTLAGTRQPRRIS